MTEPWRVAVVGPEFFLDANRRVYSRLKVLRADWPRVTFHIITETTGAVAGAAIRAAKKLKMEYAAVGDPLSRAERVICWWDFAHKPTGDLIFRALQQKLPTEVYNRENEPAGPEAADEVIGWTL